MAGFDENTRYLRSEKFRADMLVVAQAIRTATDGMDARAVCVATMQIAAAQAVLDGTDRETFLRFAARAFTDIEHEAQKIFAAMPTAGRA